MTFYQIYQNMSYSELLTYIKTLQFSKTYGFKKKIHKKKNVKGKEQESDCNLIGCLDDILKLSDCHIGIRSVISLLKKHLYIDFFQNDWKNKKLMTIKINLNKTVDTQILKIEKSCNLLREGYDDYEVFVYKAKD